MRRAIAQPQAQELAQGTLALATTAATLAPAQAITTLALDTTTTAPQVE